MTALMNYKSLMNDFLNLFYPDVCVSCGQSLYSYEEWLCYQCRHKLPKSNFHLDIEYSLIKKTLYGRVPVWGSAAYYLFNKKSSVQNILHHIKYKKSAHLAKMLGLWMGRDLLNTNWVKDIDCFVPVPLHQKKLKERGYNQSEEYAKGLSQEMKIPVKNILDKNIYTSTQTKKKRYERWENVKDNFNVTRHLSDIKHIALIDDVMTTGATFESAYISLKNSGYSGKISIITIAFATD